MRVPAGFQYFECHGLRRAIKDQLKSILDGFTSFLIVNCRTDKKDLAKTDVDAVFGFQNIEKLVVKLLPFVFHKGCRSRAASMVE